MWWNSLCASGAVALIFFSVSGAQAFGPGPSKPAGAGIVELVHSVYEAEETLHRRGYYDIRLERATLPYSFNACKHGIPFHIHVGCYGELVEKDAIGPCERDDYGYYGQRRYHPERGRYWRGY